MWIGSFDNSTMEFGEGKVYDFPRDSSCQATFCNVEGITWVDEKAGILAAVSDKMKSKGKQPFACHAKDQAMQLIQLP